MMLQCLVRKFSLTDSTAIALALFLIKSSHISGISNATGFDCLKKSSSVAHFFAISSFGSYNSANTVSSFSIPSRTLFAYPTSSSKGLLNVGYLVDIIQPNLFYIFN